MGDKLKRLILKPGEKPDSSIEGQMWPTKAKAIPVQEQRLIGAIWAAEQIGHLLIQLVVKQRKSVDDVLALLGTGEWMNHE